MQALSDPCRINGCRSSLRRKSPMATVLSHQVPAAEVTKTPKTEKISEKMRPMCQTPWSGQENLARPRPICNLKLVLRQLPLNVFNLRCTTARIDRLHCIKKRLL